MAVFSLIPSLLCLMTVGCAFGKPSRTPEETFILEKQSHVPYNELGLRLESESNLYQADDQRLQKSREEQDAEKLKNSLQKRLLKNGVSKETKGVIIPRSRSFQTKQISEQNFARRGFSVKAGIASPPRGVKFENNSERGTELIKLLQKKYKIINTPALHSGTALVGKCDLHYIFVDVLSLTVVTANFTFSLITEGSLIAADISTCLTQVNPFSFIGCVYELFKTVPDQIKNVIQDVRFFATSVRWLVPDLYHEIGSCFGRNVTEQIAMLWAHRLREFGSESGEK